MAIGLSTDEATIEAVKGFEYVPVRQRVRLAPNQTSVATLTLKRWTDLPALGWHSGLDHVDAELERWVADGPPTRLGPCNVLLSRLSELRLERARSLLVAAYVVAIWAMTTKPV